MPRSLKSLSTTSQPHADSPGGHMQVQYFTAHVHHDGLAQGDIHFSLAYPAYQDVIDVVYYGERDGKIYIATNASIRPIVFARAEMVGQQHPEELLHREGLGVIYNIEKGDISVIDAVARAAREKLGCEIDTRRIHVGNPYYPSIGMSGEACIPCFCRINELPQNLISRTYGDDFSGEREVAWIPLHDIILHRHSGKIDDFRLVFLAYLTAYITETPLPDLPGNRRLMGENTDDIGNITQIDGVSQVKHFLREHHQYDPHIVIDQQETPLQPYVSIYDLAVQNTYSDATSQTYSAQMAVRQGYDSADMCSYYMQDGKLYIAMKYSLRPSLSARNFQPHYIHTHTHPRQMEGISVSLDEAFPGVFSSEYGCIVEQQFSKKIQFKKVTPQSVLYGGFFPSIGNSSEYVVLMMQHISPTVCEAAAEWGGLFPAQIFSVECDTIIQAYLQGYIADPRVVFQALVLRHATGYENPYSRPITQKDKELFQEVLHQPLQVDSFMKHAAELKGQAIYDLHVAGKKYSTWYRRLVAYVEQELGGFLGERDWLLSETDKSFFSAMLPMFAVPSEELMEKYINYITHDQGHYLQGDIIPYDPETKTWMDKEEYVRHMSWTEANAVFDSDVLYPQQMGLERFEAIIGGESVASSFHRLGIHDDEKMREIIIQIERDGYIPDEILLHPEYDHARKNIVARLLRFHYMDKTQAAAQYDTWKTMPYVAETALRFCRTINNLEHFEQRMASYHDVIQQYDEGVNPIKAYVARLNVKYIDMFALHLAYYMQSVADLSVGGYEQELQRCHDMLVVLEKHQSSVAYLHDHIVSVASNEDAIKTVRYAHEIYEKLHVLRTSYDARVEISPYITDDRRSRLIGSRVPYFTGFVQMPDTMNDEILDIEKRNLARVGK